MIKLIWISDNEKDAGIVFWLIKKLSKEKTYLEVEGEEAENIVEREFTDLLYVNVMRPANTDVIDTLCFRNINRLRVSIFILRPFKFRILKALFPPEIIKAISQN